MNRSGLIAFVLLLSGIGLVYAACDAGYNTSDVHKYTCLKIMYTSPEGKNLTIDIYDPADHNCTAATTMTTYMDAAGHCAINGKHNPYEICKCAHSEPCDANCTCVSDLTFLEMMNKSMMFLR